MHQKITNIAHLRFVVIHLKNNERNYKCRVNSQQRYMVFYSYVKGGARRPSRMKQRFPLEKKWKAWGKGDELKMHFQLSCICFCMIFI